MSFPDIVILAGGKGTRLKNTVPDLPKPMAPVAGKPFLEYLLNFLKSHGARNIILSVGYMHDRIISHFGDEFQGLSIEYSIEQEPLDTGGAIKLALEHCQSENILIYNGDTFFASSPMELVRFHLEHESTISIYLKPMNHPDRYGTVEMDRNRVISFKEKNTALNFGLINAGVYCISKAIMAAYKKNSVFSFEKEILEPMAKDRNIYGLVSDAYFIDIGIPEDYERANETFRNLEY